MNSDHLAESTSVTSHSVSDRGVALADVHDGEHSQPLFTSTPAVNPTHTQVSGNHDAIYNLIKLLLDAISDMVPTQSHGALSIT